MTRKAEVYIGVDEVGRAAKRRASSKTIFVGIDEVGRGPLAGPITVGAVALIINTRQKAMSDKFLRGIRDSKKLTPIKREEWYAALRNESRFTIACVSVNHTVIDKKGLSYAARFAVAKCLKKISQDLGVSGDRFQVLLDAGLFAPVEYQQERIVKGDEKIPLIAAASIIAKVTRDKYMTRIHKKYSQYGFMKHKGYGTSAHIALIKKYGLSGIHRKTFCTRII